MIAIVLISCLHTDVACFVYHVERHESRLLCFYWKKIYTAIPERHPLTTDKYLVNVILNLTGSERDNGAGTASPQTKQIRTDELVDNQLASKETNRSDRLMVGIRGLPYNDLCQTYIFAVCLPNYVIIQPPTQLV